MTLHYDYVIIGSGAGGATFAQRVAPSGKSVLIIERGQHIPCLLYTSPSPRD